MRESSGSDAQRANAGEKSHGHHVLHGHVSDSHTAALLDAFKEVLDKSVHPLTQTLEHNKGQRDSQDSIKHAEGLPGIGSRCCMPITWKKKVEKLVKDFWGKQYSMSTQLLFTNMTKQEPSLRVCKCCQKGIE